MIPLYLARPMAGTPFTPPAARAEMEAAGIRFVEKAAQAEVIVSHSSRTLLPYRVLFPWKRFLVWTNEPRFDRNLHTPLSVVDLSRVDVMNVFTGNIFWNNLHFLGSYHFNSDVDLGIDLSKPLALLRREDVHGFEKKSAVAFFCYRGHRDTSFIKDGVDIDLERVRIQIALTGKKRGLADIIGKDWPAGLTLENSGFGCEVQREGRAVSWWDRKMEMLKAYHFNICLENTACAYYCTEKIWHAIASGCLPIYHGKGTTIYETFPRGSFLDSSEFADFDKLFDAVEAMTLDEYVERMNACIEAFNQACAEKSRTIHDSIREATGKILTQLLP